MDHNAAAGNGLRAGLIDVVTAGSIVVQNPARAPNLDAELVHSTPAVDLAVGRREEEAEVARAIDGPGTFVLGFRARDDQPLIDRAVEVQVPGFELELRFARWSRRTLQIFGDEAKVRFPDQAWIGHISA